MRKIADEYLTAAAGPTSHSPPPIEVAAMIAPGPIRGTEMFHAFVPAGSERERAIARQIPVGRVGAPADVANAVLFFAARESSFVTGQVLYVCGGASVGTLVV